MTNIITKNSISKKILDAITSPTQTLKKYPSSPLISLPITTLILQSKDINEIFKKEEENEYTIGNYLIKRTLGQGTFGKVKLGIYLPNKEKVAVKILEKDRIIEKDDEIRVRREFDMLAKFNHPNVILVAEIFESTNSFYSVMEYCEGGELFNYIVKNQRLNEEEAAFFYYQLINGLEYIHSLGIVHRDLKPENLLLTNEHLLKIIDFGLSNYFTKEPDQKLLITPCGSPCYASPEMVAGKKYNGFKIDIWATGIILYAMLCGYLPFEDKNNDSLFKKILECKVKFPRYIGEKAKDLIKKILVNDPDKRISIHDIKHHPFYLKGKSVFELEFSLCHNSSAENELKLSNSNLNINIDNFDDKENKDKNNISKGKDNDSKKLFLDDDNILLTLQQDAIYKPQKTEYTDKSCQFYSEFQTSEQDLNVAIEENNKNDDKIIMQEKNEKKIEEKNKNENNNKSVKNKIKNKKDKRMKKSLLSSKSKSKEYIHNENMLKKNKENYLRKNNYRLCFKKDNETNVHKTNTHSNLKKKGYSVGLTNIIKKYCNKKLTKKEKPKLNINIHNINNVNNINNYLTHDINKNIRFTGPQISPSDKKEKKLKSIDLNKNNCNSGEKQKVYLETDINDIKKEKEKDKKFSKKNNININNERKLKIKKLANEVELNINANKNELNKFNGDNLYEDNNRILKTETNNNNIEEDSKLKKSINSKNNTAVNTITNNSNTGNSKIHKNININNIIGNNQKGKILYKKQKHYILEFNGHKRRINIIACKRNKKNSKSNKKTTPKIEHRNKNMINKNLEKDKKKVSNLLIKTEGNNYSENMNMIKGITVDKEVKTETDNQEKKIIKINSNYKIKKDHIKSSSNVKKITNLIDQSKYNRAFNIPIETLCCTRNIKKNTSKYITKTNSTTNKSYSKIQKHKYTNTGLILKNTNISNFYSNNNEIKMKVNTNPNISNNKNRISNYNNIPKNKKELVTIRNTVINFNMVNSSLVISSLNKKRHSISNSFHFLNKKINSKKNLNKNKPHINRTLNNANFTSATTLKSNKSNEKMNPSIKNYSNNNKKNKIIINNIQKKEILNYSENVAKTENNEPSINKIQNKLEKILMNKLKQNNSQERKHIKYNSLKSEEYNKSYAGKNKIIKKKTITFSKHFSNKCTTNSIFLTNKSISPINKNIKTINSSGLNSNKLIFVQKQNRFINFSQSANGQKKLTKKMG